MQERGKGECILLGFCLVKKKVLTQFHFDALVYNYGNGATFEGEYCVIFKLVPLQKLGFKESFDQIRDVSLLLKLGNNTRPEP